MGSCLSCLGQPKQQQDGKANFDDIKPSPDQHPAPPQTEPPPRTQPTPPPPSRPTSPEPPRKTLEESTAETETLWDKHRKEGDQHAKRMHELFDAASAAHKAGDGAKAKALSTQGHTEQTAMKAAQAKAANAIFAAKNKDQPEGTIDLHGLLVNEALVVVEEQVVSGMKKGLPTLRIIVGAGHHSGPGGPKLRPAVEKWLKENRMKWQEDADNESNGSLIVTLS